jgi:hypothetical protein
VSISEISQFKNCLPFLNSYNPEVLKFHASLVCLGLAASGCAAHHAPLPRSDYGIQPCPATAGERLLTTDALQCWFDASHGRWRTVSHESHYAVLVVNVEATDVRDAETIARRFVERERRTFTEILVYVQESLKAGMIRRVRWTTDAGFETIDFVTP